MSDCNGCTICCKFMGVDEIEKQRNVWCKHCDIGVGCQIYETRPDSCRVYECVWLKTQSLDMPMAPELRPDKSRVVVGTVNDGEELVLYVSPDQPDAWKRKRFYEFITDMLKKGVSISVSCGDVVKKIS